MKLDEALDDVQGSGAAVDLESRLVARDAQVALGPDEAELIGLLARGGGLDALLAWVRWQAQGSVEREVCAEGLDLVFDGLRAELMRHYVAAA
jgi:hypothetical protein